MKIGDAFVVTLLSAASAMYFSLPSQANDQVVTSLLDDPNPGKLTLREALGLVSEGNTISFAPGLNGGTIRLNPARGKLMLTRNNVTITASTLPKGLQIDGNGTDNGILRLAYEDTLVDLTFSRGRSVSGAGAVDATVGRARIERCNFSENVSAHRGGAVAAANSVITNCTFVNNRARDGGALVLDRGYSGGSTVSYCEFTNNHATGPDSTGGAVLVYDSFDINNIDHCTFSENHSDNLGGAVSTDSGNITDCIFENNNSGREDAVLHIYGTVRVSRSQFSHNRRQAAINIFCPPQDNVIVDSSAVEDNEGNGIVIEQGKLELRNSSIRRNRFKAIDNYDELSVDHCQLMDNAGQGIYCSYGSRRLNVRESTIANNSNGGIAIWTDNPNFIAQIDRSTVSDNTALAAAGLEIHGGRMTVSNSTISGNRTRSGPGGGIWVASPTDSVADVRLTACTIANNQANNSRGGGIAIAPGPNAQLRLNNVLVANNIDGRNVAPDVSGEVMPFEGHNFVSRMDGSSGWGETDLTGTIDEPLDPLIDKLAFNGGPTKTHALLPGSPAIGTGNPALSGTISQNDVTRGASVDIGAYQTPRRGRSPLRGRI